MSPFTRRRALQAAAATAAAGLAGCAGEESSSSGSYPPEDDPNRRALLDPPRRRLRTTDPRPLVWTGERPTEPDEERRRRRRLGDQFLIADEDDRQALSFAAVEGADAARAFVADTDFDSAVVYVESEPVEECFRRELCYVAWTDDEIDTDYVRRYRAPEVDCETDTVDVTATLFRVPETLDPGEVSGYGSGFGTGECHVPPPIRRAAERTNGEPSGDGGSS